VVTLSLERATSILCSLFRLYGVVKRRQQATIFHLASWKATNRNLPRYGISWTISFNLARGEPGGIVSVVKKAEMNEGVKAAYSGVSLPG